jgi:hypothetical protein
MIFPKSGCPYISMTCLGVVTVAGG